MDAIMVNGFNQLRDKDLRICCIGEISYAMLGQHMYGSRTAFLEEFYRDELITVYDSKKPCRLQILDERGELVRPFEVESNFLRLSPNMFGKGYSLCRGPHVILELDMDSWNRLKTPCFETKH